MIDVKAALDELQSKTAGQIERETAEKWLARSLAAYSLHVKHRLAGKGDWSLQWFAHAEEYRHEAIEHAALAEDDGATLRLVTDETQRWRTRIEAAAQRSK